MILMMERSADHSTFIIDKEIWMLSRIKLFATAISLAILTGCASICRSASWQNRSNAST